MALIDRTAYPRFKRFVSERELVDHFTPTAAETAFATETTRSWDSRFNLLLLLKCFRRLGYFPNIEEIPEPVVAHLRSCLALLPDILPGYDSPRTLYRHHALIRNFLSVRAYDHEARRAAGRAMLDAAKVKNIPADLINVRIESLVRDCRELPAFSALERMARHIRATVNRAIFATVSKRLSEQERDALDTLTLVQPDQPRSFFNRLKQVSPNPTLAHFRELVEHRDWVVSWSGFENALEGVAPAKLDAFAAEARTLDAGEMKDLAPAKRHTLIISLIRRARVQTTDELVQMFLRRMATLHRRGKEELEILRAGIRERVERLLATFSALLQVVVPARTDAEVGREVRTILADPESLQQECARILAFTGDDYHGLLWPLYRSHRSTLFRLLNALDFQPTHEDRSLARAVGFLKSNESKRANRLEAALDLSFASASWRRLALIHEGENVVLDRRHFEVAVFSHLAADLKSGDLSVGGSESFADYRRQLLDWPEVASRLPEYCGHIGISQTAATFVRELRANLSEAANRVDLDYPQNSALIIGENGLPVLKRTHAPPPSASARALETAVRQRLPERHLLEILRDTSHWIDWTRHFGPLTGNEPKLERPRERYLLTVFAYGCNLGPTQAARHLRGVVSPHELSFVHRRHISGTALEKALTDLNDGFHRLALPKMWGDERRAAADGTKYDLGERNLLAEYHIRYGSYGGIAYHHVSDCYVALFSHFIPCGVWEAVHILDGLLKNRSTIQPDTLHADTQGQSTPVFGLAHLLGIKLMPRIRNWRDLVFYRPEANATYRHIDALFGDAVDWELIQTHYPDMLRVVLSIKAGKITSSVLLRKLGSYSRRNKLYQAFRELGRVERTIFLLSYISDPELRAGITASTNKVESYNGFAKWFFFGGEGVIAANDAIDQEKSIKYNDLVANAVIFRNVVDQARVIAELVAEGIQVRPEDVATLSPYLTAHVKRFGDYEINVEDIPSDLPTSLSELPFQR